MAGKRRRTRQKQWRPPLIPFNQLPICHCGCEIGMKRKIWMLINGRPRHRQVECCLTCACDWTWPRLSWPRPEGWRMPAVMGQRRIDQQQDDRDAALIGANLPEPRGRSLRERLYG